MSKRAIQKLREDRQAALAMQEAEEHESSDEEELPSRNKTKASAFALMNDSDSVSDSDSEDESERDNKLEQIDPSVVESEPTKAEVTEEEENLDDLLEEFKIQDDKAGVHENSKEEVGVDDNNDCQHFSMLWQGMDLRDLDVDHVMRTSLLSADPDAGKSSSAPKNKRRNRQTFLFGSPRDLNVNVKPPNYVGGGMGMRDYNQPEMVSRKLPWPYSGFQQGNDSEVITLPDSLQDRKRWYTFIQADSYQKDVKDFRIIQETGDINALVLFVAHHPFVAEALMAVGMVLYQVNQANEGLTFLRRALFVFETATISSFSTAVDSQNAVLMDYEQQENQVYFQALFRLARVNHIAGLSRSPLAISRYLLSLDPLRDPTGTLLALDCYALSTNIDHNLQWFVDLIESKTIQVHYRDEISGVEHQCDLLQMPNYAYSYSLALFLLNNSRSDERANQALQSAINNFPHLVDALLQENDVDTTSQSCRMNWQAVLVYTAHRANKIEKAMNGMDPVIRMATEKAYELICRVFVKLNHKLWSADSVLLWINQNLEELKADDTRNTDSSSNNPSENTQALLQTLQPAMMRYARINPGDYDMKFQLLPAEANPLDMGLVQHAMVIDPNRRRFLRQQRDGRAGGNEEDLIQQMLMGNAVRRTTLLGPPTQTIDLDWPMLEIFWRSLLPWNRIEEIPRPPPPANL